MNEVNSLMEYIEWINKMYSTLATPYRQLFFRGHGNKEWDLLPSAFRKNFLNEREIILDAKQVLYPEADYFNCLEKILVQMQHHGIPTRLLDWSISPLVALYFVCSSERDKTGEVYSLNPWKCFHRNANKPVPTYYFEILKQARLALSLNWSLEEVIRFISRKYEYCLETSELEEPLPLVGRYMDTRVDSQSGCFVLWGWQKTILDCFRIFRSNIESIIIPAERKHILLEELVKLGINSFSIFKDFEGAASQIRKTGGLFRI